MKARDLAVGARLTWRRETYIVQRVDGDDIFATLDGTLYVFHFDGRSWKRLAT